MENNKAVLQMLRQSTLFAKLDDSILREIVNIATWEKVHAADFLFHEGDKADTLYIIYDGIVEVIKKEVHTLSDYPIARLSKGNIIGEMALFTQTARTASIRALTDTKLLVISFIDLGILADKDSRYMQINARIACQLSQQLHQSNQEIVKAYEKEKKYLIQKSQTGYFIAVTISTLCFIALALSTFQKLATQLENSTTVLLIFLLTLFGFNIYFFIKARLPLSAYGVTTTNWQKSIGESLLYTIPVLLLIFCPV